LVWLLPLDPHYGTKTTMKVPQLWVFSGPSFLSLFIPELSRLDMLSSRFDPKWLERGKRFEKGDILLPGPVELHHL
jgi:hypothetical protein